MTQRTTSTGQLFAGMNYRQAVDLVDAAPGVSPALRRRLVEDQQRLATLSLRDAQILRALQRLRVDAMLQAWHKIDRHH